MEWIVFLNGTFLSLHVYGNAESDKVTVSYS
jgi:hypothetical protein